MNFLSVITGTYNEVENVLELYERICQTFAEKLPNYTFELIFIDNASTDSTVEVLKGIAATDKRVKIIVNNRNFGQIRSGYHAFLQAKGDAVVVMVSDLQDPPEMIPQFVKKWEEGYKIVLAQKTNSKESPIFFYIRKLYYNLSIDYPRSNSLRTLPALDFMIEGSLKTFGGSMILIHTFAA